MPSSHSAIVMAITVMVGRIYGFNSVLFAMSLVFSSVVMYDAAGVRRAAGKQVELLNRIIETPGLTGVEVQERLVEVLGHSPMQVFVGAVIGIIVGSIVWKIITFFQTFVCLSRIDRKEWNLLWKLW